MQTAFSNVVNRRTLSLSHTRSRYSNTVQGKTLHIDGFGDGDGDGLDHPGGAIQFQLIPLLGGFVAVLECPRAGWFDALNAAQIRLSYYVAAPGFVSQNVEIYAVEPGQNMTLQKTVLGLPHSHEVRARFMLLDESGDAVFVSTLASVQTLARIGANSL
jgi:hypothetical protein